MNKPAMVDKLVTQHSEIATLQWERADSRSLEVRLANLLYGYRNDHDQADPWGHCDCKKCKQVDELLRPV